MPDRRIPDGIKRLVRQRCGYGCVRCGFPIYEYDHMFGGWAVTQRHRPEEITLLCPNDHLAKTKGLLADADVEAADREPFNLRSSATASYAMFYGTEPVLFGLGSNLFEPPSYPFFGVVVDGIPLFSSRIENDRCLVSMVVLDINNQLQLLIEDNELRFRSDHWDVDFSGQHLTIRRGLRRIALRLRFEPPNLVVIELGQLACNGFVIELSKEGLQVAGNNVRVSDSRIALQRAIAVGAHAEAVGAYFVARDSETVRRPGGWERNKVGWLNPDWPKMARLPEAAFRSDSVPGPVLKWDWKF